MYCSRLIYIYIKICSPHSSFATWKVDAWQADTCLGCIKRKTSFNLRICWAFIVRGISIVFWTTTFWLCMWSVGPASITLNLMKQRNVGRLSPSFCGAWKRLSFFQISEMVRVKLLHMQLLYRLFESLLHLFFFCEA